LEQLQQEELRLQQQQQQLIEQQQQGEQLQQQQQQQQQLQALQLQAEQQQARDDQERHQHQSYLECQSLLPQIEELEEFLPSLPPSPLPDLPPSPHDSHSTEFTIEPFEMSESSQQAESDLAASTESNSIPSPSNNTASSSSSSSSSPSLAPNHFPLRFMQGEKPIFELACDFSLPIAQVKQLTYQKMNESQDAATAADASLVKIMWSVGQAHDEDHYTSTLEFCCTSCFSLSIIFVVLLSLCFVLCWMLLGFFKVNCCEMIRLSLSTNHSLHSPSYMYTPYQIMPRWQQQQQQHSKIRMVFVIVIMATPLLRDETM
jgi:hypothetical protein